MDSIDLKFDASGLDYMVEKAVEFKLGARGLRSIMEAVLNDSMFELPGTGEKELTVTRTFAEKHFTDNQQSGLRVA
jgi:ATP-dependent Clp protease ATP-binding subunit ClpX